MKKVINRVLSALAYNYTEQQASIVENYQRRLEDVAMPWEKYLISDQADRSN